MLKIAKAPFYRSLACPAFDRDLDQAQLISAAKDAHEEPPAFEYRLIADELDGVGFDASERRVWRICSENGIVSAIMAAVEQQPGEWWMTAQYERPYASVRLLRVGGELGYRAITYAERREDRELIGFFRTLRAATYWAHRHWLRTLASRAASTFTS